MFVLLVQLILYKTFTLSKKINSRYGKDLRDVWKRVYITTEKAIGHKPLLNMVSTPLFKIRSVSRVHKARVVFKL